MLKHHQIVDEEDDPVTKEAANSASVISEDESAAEEDNPQIENADNAADVATDEETYSTTDDMSD